jgi:hypothetical protein
MTLILIFTAAIVLAFGLGYVIGLIRMNRAIMRIMTKPIEELTKRGD